MELDQLDLALLTALRERVTTLARSKPLYEGLEEWRLLG